MNLTRVGAGGAGSGRSLAGKTGRSGQHVLTHNGSSGTHLNAVGIGGAAIQQCVTAAYFGGRIVHGGAGKDWIVPAGTSGEHARELIGDLDLETSQRGSVVVAQRRKLLRAGGDCRQQSDHYYCCKNALHGFLLSCSSF